MNIYEAIDSDNIDLIKQLIYQNPVLITSKNKDKQTPADYAMTHNKRRILEFLIQINVDIDLPETLNINDNLIAIAIQDQNLDMIKFLLNNPNIHINNNHGDRFSRMSDLIFAVVKITDPEIIQLLISKGSDLEHKTRQGYTALKVAVNYDNINAIRVLVKNGAKIDSYKYSRETKQLLESIKHEFYRTQKQLIAGRSRMFAGKRPGIEVLNELSLNFEDTPFVSEHEKLYTTHMGATTEPGGFVSETGYIHDLKYKRGEKLMLYAKENQKLRNSTLFDLVKDSNRDIFTDPEIRHLIRQARSYKEPSVVEEFLFQKGYLPGNIDYVMEILKSKPSRKLLIQKLESSLSPDDLNGLLKLLSK